MKTSLAYLTVYGAALYSLLTMGSPTFGVEVADAAPQAAFEAGVFGAAVPRTYIGDELRAAFGLNGAPAFWTARTLASLPESVLRESLFMRETSMRCTDAARAWLDERELIEVGAEVRRQDTIHTRRRYVETCLTPFESISDSEGGWDGSRPENSKFLISLLGEKGVARLRASIVYMPESTGSCSGTLAWIPDGNHEVFGLLTAAHCLGSSIVEFAGGRLIASMALFDTIELIDLGGSRRSFTVGDAWRRVQYDISDGDVAFVPLKADVSRDEVGLDLAVAALTPWQHLYILGQNDLLRRHRAYMRNADPRQADDIPLHGTVVTMGTGCRALGQFGRLLLQNCQTIEGTSGSAILVFEADGLRLIGVHSGYRDQFDNLATNNEGLEKALMESSAQNYGTLLLSDSSAPAHQDE